MPEEITDYQAAENMRNGAPSPLKFGEFWLFDVRITGTGAAWRDSIQEFAYREKELWTSPEFIKRCNGLPLIFEHPEKAGLNSEEFNNRVIGTIILPYVRDDEVWGIAKVFDESAVELMCSSHRSTSPGITTSKGSTTSLSQDGTKILNEGLPVVLDHLAVCDRGVWDKSSEEPLGIRLNALGAKERSVDEAEKKRLEDERKALQDKLDAANRRADSAEATLKERKDAEDKEKADKAKRDSEESERQAVEKSEKERADRKKRHDCERMDGESDEMWDKRKADARKDESEDEKKEREGREDAAKKDAQAKKDAAAKTENVDAEVDKLQDTQKRHDADLKALQAEIAALKRQPTMDDANAIATAYHRYDSIYQMLGERVPQHMPGESPIAYRRRLADGLRKHTKTWKEHVLHDAVTGPAFDMLEQSIIDEALAEAKNPTRTDANAGRLIERTTVQNGKTRTEFYGDSSVAFAPFEAPVMSFKFKKPSKAA
jgi:hypothetical protein